MEFKHFVIIGIIFCAIIAGAVVFAVMNSPEMTALNPNIPVIQKATPVEGGGYLIPTDTPTPYIPPTPIQTTTIPSSYTPISTTAPTHTETTYATTPRPTSNFGSPGPIRVEEGNNVNTWNVENANFVEKTHHYIPYTTENQITGDRHFDGDEWITHDYWHYRYLSLKNIIETKQEAYNANPRAYSLQDQRDLDKLKLELDELKRICDQLCVDCRYCNYFWRGMR